MDWYSPQRLMSLIVVALVLGGGLLTAPSSSAGAGMQYAHPSSHVSLRASGWHRQQLATDVGGLWKTVQLHGEWKFSNYNPPLVCATCSEEPLTSIFRGPATASYGEPIPFETGFDKLGANVITLTQPVILHVQVGRVGQHNPLWEAVLPPLRGEIPPGTAFIRFRVIWNQRDATGRMITRGGDYWAGVLLPERIEYATADLVGHQERLDKQRRGVVVHIQ